MEVSLFLAQVASRWTINAAKMGSVLSECLAGSPTLGLHTTVVVMRYAPRPDGEIAFTEREYVFASKTSRPLGAPLPAQCSCGAFYSFDHFKDLGASGKGKNKGKGGPLKAEERRLQYNCMQCGKVSVVGVKTPLSTIPCGPQGTCWQVHKAHRG